MAQNNPTKRQTIDGSHLQAPVDWITCYFSFAMNPNWMDDMEGYLLTSWEKSYSITKLGLAVGRLAICGDVNVSGCSKAGHFGTFLKIAP